MATQTVNRFDHERRQRLDRSERREFRQLLSLIIHHQAEPDTEPRNRAFVCQVCHHVLTLCTCKEVTL